jgi:hypothetical protein
MYMLHQNIIEYGEDDSPVVIARNVTVEDITVDDDHHVRGIWEEQLPANRVRLNHVAQSWAFDHSWMLI